MKILKTRIVRLPERATSKSAGIDFFAPDNYVREEVGSLEGIIIKTGIYAKIPEGFMLEIKDRSSMAIEGWKVGACVIDKTKAIAQGILIPVNYEDTEVEFSKADLYTEATDRGAGGFGSTNKN